MDTFVSILLILISMIALLILSYTGGINKELQKPTKHFGHVFIGASVWAMGFAVMMLMDNTLYAHIARAVGVAGMHCAMVFMLLYAQSICRKQFEPNMQLSFLQYLITAAIASYIMDAIPAAIEFVRTPYGLLFINNRLWLGRYLQMIIIIAYYFFWFYFCITAFYKAKLKRERVIARSLIETGIVMLVGSSVDILIPLFGVPTIQWSLFLTFVSLLLLLRTRRINGDGFLGGKKLTEIIYSSADVAFAVLDNDHRIISINERAKELVGISDLNVIGHRMLEYMVVDENEVIDDVAASIANRITDYSHDVVTRYTGKEVHIESRVLYDRYHQVLSILLILSDHTAEKEYIKTIEEGKKEIEIANKAKETFMNKITSGLKQPLESILDTVKSVEIEIPDMLKPRMYQIRESARSLLGTMNDIIDIATMESESFEIDNIKYDMKELLQSVVEECAEKVNEEQVTLVSHINSSMPRELIGDPRRIRQVLYNLLDNATKYTEKGYITLQVEYRVHYRKVIVNFSVADTGIGIKKENMDSIFGVETEGKGNGSVGNGLGLSLCRNIIKLMGGEMSIKSVVGRGTSFTFSLEQRIDSEKSIVPFMEYHENVLLLETDQILADAEEKTLKEMGLHYDVVVVSEMLAADAIPKTGDYSVIFASAKILRRHRMLLRTAFPDSRIVTINNYNQYSMSAMNNDSICAPLFFAQISDVLKNELQN